MRDVERLVKAICSGLMTDLQWINKTAAQYGVGGPGVHAMLVAIDHERERCARVAEWFANVENFTAADVAKRIRDGLSE